MWIATYEMDIYGEPNHCEFAYSNNNGYGMAQMAHYRSSGPLGLFRTRKEIIWTTSY